METTEVQYQTEQEYYSMSRQRTEAIAASGGLSYEQVRAYCLGDWPEGEEHQDWLNSAPAMEIADWIKAGA